MDSNAACVRLRTWFLWKWIIRWKFNRAKNNARTSYPGGNQVDGLPPASSLWSGTSEIKIPQNLYIRLTYNHQIAELLAPKEVMKKYGTISIGLGRFEGDVKFAQFRKVFMVIEIRIYPL